MALTINHWTLQVLAIGIYQLKHGLAPDIMSDIFGQRYMSYETHKVPSFSIWVIETTRCGSEKISFLGPKIWELLPQNTKEKTFLKPDNVCVVYVKLTSHK